MSWSIFTCIKTRFRQVPDIMLARQKPLYPNNPSTPPSGSNTHVIYTGKFPTKTTITAQYAAVAVMISYLRDCISQHSVDEKMPVKTAIVQSLVVMAAMLYRTTIGMVNETMANAVVRNREAAMTRDGSKRMTLSSSDLHRSLW